LIRLYSHKSAEEHEPGPGHPEAPVRIRAIEEALADADLDFIERLEAPRATIEQIERIHPAPYPGDILDAVPASGYVRIDPDTVMNHASGEASLRASGGVCAGVDDVIAGKSKRAFCLMRPPGHHAEPDRAMGFCFFNQIAVGAAHARAVHGVRRISIVDFDVHHGNGTQAAFWNDADTQYVSSHQWPLFPGTGRESERGAHGNIVNLTFGDGTTGAAWRNRMEAEALPSIDAFEPELVLISAGFDAHERDPLASMRLVEEDFAWITERLVEIAETHASGRVVACLEGGYSPPDLATSFLAHLHALNDR
jgi:acetoin utilization deacetylase AcuC-like enzyme